MPSNEESGQSQPNPVADNANATVEPITDKPSQAEGEDDLSADPQSPVGDASTGSGPIDSVPVDSGPVDSGPATE